MYTSDLTDESHEDRVGRVRLRRFLVVSVLWAIGLAMISDPVVSLCWYLTFAIYAVVQMYRRVQGLPDSARRATRLVVYGAILAVTALFVRAGHVLISNNADPFPSVADVFNIGSYVVFTIAVLWIVKCRVSRLSLDPILDATVGAVAAALLQWSLVLLAYLRIDGLPLMEVLVNLTYSVLSLLLVIAAVLALVAGSTPSASNRLLAAALVTLFAADAVAILASSGRLPDEVGLALAPLALVLGTAGILHPSVVSIAAEPSEADRTRRLSRRRITVLALALLTPPALMLTNAITADQDGWTLLPAVAALVLSPLVLTRLGRLVRQNEELASLESTLRSVGERLVSAESSDEVVNIISAGAEQILGVSLLTAELVLDPLSEGHNMPGADIGWIRDSIAEVDESRAITGALRDASEDESTESRTLGLIVLQRELYGVLALVTRRPLREEERNAVTTLCRESAIAFRAVEHTEQQVRRRSEDRFATLVDNSSDIVAVLDPQRRLGYVSPVVDRLLGYRPDEFVETDVMELVHPDDRGAALKMLDDIRFGLRETSVIRLRHAGGGYHWFEMVGVDLSSDPNIGGIVLNAREITDRKEAEERLVLSEARFKALVQHSTDLVVVLNPDRRVRYASPSVTEVLGQTPDDVHGHPLTEVFRDSDVDWSALLERSSANAGGQQLVEFTFQNASQQWRTIETTITDLRSEPAVHGFVLNARDITERKNMEQRLRYQATHDELTGLANRVHVLDDLTGMLGRNSGSTTVAAILIGIDNFKEINDSLGHAAGDDLLIAAAKRITSMLGFGDIAARVGGDEYVVVLERAHGENHVTDLAEQILTAIANPYTVEGRELSITASAGIVFDHDRSHTAEILLRNADIAMYRAKTLGKRQTVVFEPHMHTDSFDRLQLRADLARAVDLEQFVAHFQPVVDIASRQVVGAEALIRWQHPERGLLGPNLFIPLAEETGLIGALGEWILERACKDLVAWRKAFGGPVMDFTMSVNLSVQQLHDEGIVDTVSDILARTGLPAERLVLEVTESTLITDTERISATMQALRGLGARLAVDDFGTGYSSLGYIQQFEFDVLKIDKSFVDSLETHTNQRIITAVLELARQLEVRTIAEGIESELQANLLEDLGCCYGQGYLYSRPVPAASFTELLAASRTEHAGHARL